MPYCATRSSESSSQCVCILKVSRRNGTSTDLKTSTELIDWVYEICAQTNVPDDVEQGPQGRNEGCEDDDE